MRLNLVTGPGTYPITLAMVRAQTKTEGITTDDDLITETIIPAVVERGEGATNRQMYLATWQGILDDFPRCSSWIELPKPPLVADPDGIEISYVDQDGETQIWDPSNYLISAPQGPKCQRGRISLAYGAWPTTRCQIGAVTIQFEAGYGDDPTDVPARLRLAMLLDAGTIYRQRENIITGTIIADLPDGSKSIYRSYKSRPTQRLREFEAV